MSKLDKYRKKIIKAYGNTYASLLENETDYRVLKKIYIKGGGDPCAEFASVMKTKFTSENGMGAAELNEEHENFFKKGSDVNCGILIGLDEGQVTTLPPLHAFCIMVNKFGKEDEIYLIKKLGADVNSQNENKSTPLHCALANGSLDNSSRYNLTEYLCERGANVDDVNDFMLTPVHYSFKHDDEKTTLFLLDKSKAFQNGDSFNKTRHRTDGRRSYLIHIIINVEKKVSMNVIKKLEKYFSVRETSYPYLSTTHVSEDDSPFLAALKTIKKVAEGNKQREEKLSDIKFLVDIIEIVLQSDKSNESFEWDISFPFEASTFNPTLKALTDNHFDFSAERIKDAYEKKKMKF